nr:uncharacterized protein LOC110550084 [Meriones unguiculatus]
MAAGTPHKEGVRGRRCAPPPAGKEGRGSHRGDLVLLRPGPRRPPGAPCRARGPEAATRRSPGWVGRGLAYGPCSPRPGTRRATAPLLSNRLPSGAPPRPLWKEGSRPRGPPQHSQSAGRTGTEAGRPGLPLGAAPVRHKGGGALTCEPSEPWGATSPLHRPGSFQTPGRSAAELYAADVGRPTWLDCSRRVSRRSRPQFPLKRPGELASAVTSGAEAARASPRRKKSAR